VSLQGIDDCRLAYLDLNRIKVLEMPEVINRPQAVSTFSEAHQRMAKKIIQFLNEKGGRAKLSEIQNNFENETLESVKTLSVAPGSVVLDLIASNKLYLDSDWEVGVRSASS
jgi:pimeloyl-CoA synthetase